VLLLGAYWWLPDVVAIGIVANQKGCDGGRLYFDGCSMIWCNGAMVGQASQFEGLDEVEVLTATVCLSDVRSVRANFISRSYQAASSPTIPKIPAEICLCTEGDAQQLAMVPSVPRNPAVHTPMEEICLGPSGWLWDYLRRSGMRGYFLPLSGGAGAPHASLHSSFRHTKPNQLSYHCVQTRRLRLRWSPSCANA
jgi:NAD+ synthase (glutamine-hydrolysing)